MHNVNDVDVWLIDGAKSRMTEKKKKTAESYIDNLSITNE